jgi:hypothetical protein
VKTCLLCGQFELRIRNLETGIQMAQANAFKVGGKRDRKDRKFERLLELTHMALTARNSYDRHRRAHKQYDLSPHGRISQLR